MTEAKAFAKINLALVVGPLRGDARHEVATVLQRVDLHDVVQLEPAASGGTMVEGFAEDTLVRGALEAFAEESETVARWRVRIEKRIPPAAGLGGGSSDAAAALSLANSLAPAPLSPESLHAVAARVGADVPFFLARGAQLATGDGTELTGLELPENQVVLLALPHEDRKTSTADVYRSFDERGGAEGFEGRRAALLEVLERVARPADLAAFPRNDLASSRLAAELENLGAFRADVSGAGPTVYALFEHEDEAARAAGSLRDTAATWVVRPVSGP